MSGYSGTPLAKKLGIGAGARLFLHDAPANYRELVAPLPAGVQLSPRIDRAVDLLHVFATRQAELRRVLNEALPALRPDAAIWVSWPKQAAKRATDITEDAIRGLALPLGLVDIKVCAVDAVWSGLKLVVRKALRAERTPAPRRRTAARTRRRR